jgi:uncharacterized membrane protein
MTAYNHLHCTDNFGGLPILKSDHQGRGNQRHGESHLLILKRRHVKGEITKGGFDKMKAVITKDVCR